MSHAARSFGYKFPDFFMEYGPIEAPDLEGAKTLVRKRLGVSRNTLRKLMAKYGLRS